MLLGLSCMQSLSAQFTDVSKWYHQDICATIPSMTDITKPQEIAAVKGFYSASNNLYQNYYVLGRQYAFNSNNQTTDTWLGYSYSTFSIWDRNSNPLASFTLDSYIKEGTGTQLPHIRYAYTDFLRTSAGTDDIGYYIEFVLVGKRRDDENVGFTGQTPGVIVAKIKVHPYVAFPDLQVVWKHVVYPTFPTPQKGGFGANTEIRNVKITTMSSSSTYLISFWAGGGTIGNYRDNYYSMKFVNSAIPAFGFTGMVKQYTSTLNSDNEFLSSPIYTGTSMIVAGHSKTAAGLSEGQIFTISPTTGDITSTFKYSSSDHSLEFTDMIALPSSGGYMVSGCAKKAGISYPILMKTDMSFNPLWIRRYTVLSGIVPLNKTAWGSFLSDYNNEVNLWLKTDDSEDLLTPEEHAIRLSLDMNGNVLSFGESSGSISRMHKPLTNLLTGTSQQFINWGGHYDVTNTVLTTGKPASWFEAKQHSNTITPTILNICSEPLTLSINTCGENYIGVTTPCISIAKTAGNMENNALTLNIGGPAVLVCTRESETPEFCIDGDANTLIATANESGLNFNNVFVIAPNPTKDLLKLSGLAEMGTIHKVVILNMNGQIVQQQVIEAEKTEIEVNVSALPQGIYMLKVDTKKGQQVQKFVKE